MNNSAGYSRTHDGRNVVTDDFGCLESCASSLFGETVVIDSSRALCDDELVEEKNHFLKT